LQRLLNDGAIDGCYAEHAEDRREDPSGSGVTQFLSGQVMDSRHRMSGQQPFRLACLDSRPSGRARLNMRLPIKQNVQDDIRIEEDSLHLYFAARCFR